jgi:hypothetical protein
MRNIVAMQTGELGNSTAAAKRSPGISPELSEILHMLNSLEDNFAAIGTAK